MISTTRNRIKNVILWLLIIIVLALIAYYVIWNKYLKNYLKYKRYGKEENNIVTSIKIDDVTLPYDSNTKTFYYPVSSKQNGKEVTLNIKIETNSQAKNIIDDKEFKDSITIKRKIDFKDKIEVYSNSNYYYNKYYIAFTNLPTITISNDANDVGEDYSFGNIKVIDPEYTENESEYSMDSQMNIRIRGSSTKTSLKKSYRKKLGENNKQELSLLGMTTNSK